MNDLKRQSALGPSRAITVIALAFVTSTMLLGMASTGQDALADDETSPARPALEATRLSMGKWIETQQIISKERDEWRQGKEILTGRLDLIKKEIATLEEKIQQAQTLADEERAKRETSIAENDQLKATNAQLIEAIAGMEEGVRQLYQTIPTPIQEKLAPLFERMPAASSTTAVSVAERFQNVLGILNEINKANSEITVSYEVRTLADGRPTEVRVIYVGLAQGYYVSARGEAGIGRPSADGWNWAPSKSVAPDVLQALEILQGKQTPAFVPLPVNLQ